MKRIIITERQYKRLVYQPLNEQKDKEVSIVSDYDGAWDYKKVGGDYFAKRKTSNKWIKTTLGSKPYESIKTKVFKDTDTSDNSTTDIVTIGNDIEVDSGGGEVELHGDGVTHEIPTILHDLMYLISSKESKNHSYDSAYPSKIIDGLSEMSIEEATSVNGSSAVGRWQFMPKYMADRVQKAGLKMSDKFSEVNQDKMAMLLIKGWERLSCEEFAQKLARIWAAVPVLYDQKGNKRQIKRGQFYYEGVQGNSAGIGANEFETAVRKTGCDGSVFEDDPEDEIVVGNVPTIPFQNKTEGDAFRKWVNDNHSDYADSIDLSLTGDWKKGQKNFIGFMLKAWNIYGKEYMDGNHYEELEVSEVCDVVPYTSESELKKIKFDKILNSSNYRSGQPTLPQLAYIIDTYNIKNIVRMNGSYETSPVGREIVTIEQERVLSECKGVKFHFINAHKPNQGKGEIVNGVKMGYTSSMKEIQPILEEGNTLIHCRNGSDRTGYQVGKYLKNHGITDEQKLWDYTTDYNGWCSQSVSKFDSGYDTYAQGIINGLDEKKRQELCG